jgi:hypothetical protein
MNSKNRDKQKMLDTEEQEKPLIVNYFIKNSFIYKIIEEINKLDYCQFYLNFSDSNLNYYDKEKNIMSYGVYNFLYEDMEDIISNLNEFIKGRTDKVITIYYDIDQGVFNFCRN